MNEGHYLFGKVLCDLFDLPLEMYNWGIIPDMKYLTDDHYTWLLLHRVSLHGSKNIDYCIEIGKKRDKFLYIEKYHNAIECMILSHSYLDVFNGIVIPSYPKSYEVKYIPERMSKYIFSPLDDPDGIEDKFVDLMIDYETPAEFMKDMKKEYLDLPRNVGDMTKSILELYD